MAALYEITHEFKQLFSAFDELNSMELDTDADGKAIDAEGNVIDNPQLYKQSLLDAWFDTLEGIEGEFEYKAENVACYIKTLRAEAESLKNEERAFRVRREQKERQLKNLTEYLLNSMEAVSRTKIDMPRAVISVRNNAEKLVVDDEISLISWLQENNDELLKYSLPEIRKAEIKKLTKTGTEFPFVHMERSRSLVIR